MKLIAITQEEFFSEESTQIVRLLDGQIDRVHLRKPKATEDEIRRLIEHIPSSYYRFLSLHDHFSLVSEYGLGGVHLNSRHPEAPTSFDGFLSRSCHQVNEMMACADYDYYFLSPIFDSISKQGYSSGFTEHQLRHLGDIGVINHRVVALGGVTPERFPYLESIGFGGAALLGYVWSHPDLFY